MGKTILVVDDDQSITSIFEFILLQAGYSALIASNSAQCLEIVKKHPEIDLIFLDIKMPGVTGITTFKRITEIRQDVRVIMMTGYSVNEEVKEAFDLGAYGIVYKPFDVDEVLEMIANLFNNPNEKLPKK